MPDILHKVGVKSSSLDDTYKALATREGLSTWWTTDTRGESKMSPGKPPVGRGERRVDVDDGYALCLAEGDQGRIRLPQAGELGGLQMALFGGIVRSTTSMPRVLAASTILRRLATVVGDGIVVARVVGAAQDEEVVRVVGEHVPTKGRYHVSFP